MNRRAWGTTLVAVAVCAAGIWSWTLLEQRDGLAPELSPPPARMESPPMTPPPDPGEELRKTVEGPPLAGAEESRARLLVYPAQREIADVHGLVLDGLERPVARARVELKPSRAAIHPWLEIGEDRAAILPATTDLEGRFHFSRVPVGPYEASATGLSGLVAHESLAVTAGDAAPLTLHLCAPTIPEDLTVVVVDGARSPVAGAQVGVHLIDAAKCIQDERHAPDSSATTDARGRAMIARVPLAPMIVDASTADGRRGTAILDVDRRSHSQSRVEVLVSAPGGIEGRLTGSTPERLSGSSVRALQLLLPDQVYYASFGRSYVAPLVEGGFRFVDLPAGVFALELDSPAGLRLVLRPYPELANGVLPATVSVSAGAVTQFSGAVDEGGELTGSVTTLDGKPVAGASVRAVLAPSTSNFTDGFAILGTHVWRLDDAQAMTLVHPTAHASARTDAGGSYRIGGLTPGAWRVDVFADGLSYDQRLGVAVEASRATRLEHHLAAAGVIQGCAPDITYLGVVPAGREVPAMLAILPDDGVFTLPGLAAGNYWLGSFPSDTSVPPLRVADVRVEAGRTSWIDLSRAGDLRIDGRLIDGAGRAVQGSVTVRGRRLRTSVEGSFTFRVFGPRDGPLILPHAVVEAGGLRWRLEFSTPSGDSPGEQRILRLGEHSLDVTLLDPDGRPVAGTLELSSEDLLPSRIGIGDGGRATLRHLFAGEHALKAELQDALVPPLLVTLPVAQGIELRALACAPIEVHAVDAEGRPAARIRVYAQCWQNPEAPPEDPDQFAARAQFFETTTDHDGVARLLAPCGPVLVTACGWYVGDPMARQRIYSVRGKLERLDLTLR